MRTFVLDLVLEFLLLDPFPDPDAILKGEFKNFFKSNVASPNLVLLFTHSTSG